MFDYYIMKLEFWPGSRIPFAEFLDQIERNSKKVQIIRVMFSSHMDMAGLLARLPACRHLYEFGVRLVYVGLIAMSIYLFSFSSFPQRMQPGPWPKSSGLATKAADIGHFEKHQI